MKLGIRPENVRITPVDDVFANGGGGAKPGETMKRRPSDLIVGSALLALLFGCGGGGPERAWSGCRT